MDVSSGTLSRTYAVEQFSLICKGDFACVGEESGTKFESMDLSELSWYDYDEKAPSTHPRV